MGDYTTKPNGWELVEQRADGNWYAVRRVFGGREAYEELRNWMLSRGKTGYHGNYRLRSVNVDTPPLSAGRSDVLDYQERQEAMATQQQANEDGAALGRAFSIALTGDQNSEEYRAAVFTLGRRFASMTDYDDAESALSYIEGFVMAFRPITTRRIASPASEQADKVSIARQDAISAIIGED